MHKSCVAFDFQVVEVTQQLKKGQTTLGRLRGWGTCALRAKCGPREHLT